MFVEGALDAALVAWSAEGKAAAWTRLLTGLGLEVEAVQAVGRGPCARSWSARSAASRRIRRPTS